MSEPNSTSSISTESPSAEQVVELLKEELLNAPNAYKPGESGKRYFWPENDEIVVAVTGLPKDCSKIEAAIRKYLGHVADDNRLRFPVKEVRFDRGARCIRIIGDPNRISEMRQLPRH